MKTEPDDCIHETGNLRVTPTKTPVSSNGLLALQIQSLIADKNWITAQANADLAAYDQWQADYGQWRQEVDAELQTRFAEANVLS